LTPPLRGGPNWVQNSSDDIAVEEKDDVEENVDEHDEIVEGVNDEREHFRDRDMLSLSAPSRDWASW
jgi:hypothetical protein